MRTVLACTFGLLLAGISTSSQALAPSHIWSERFGDVDEEQGVSVAIDPAGNIIVAGFFVGTTDFGGGSVMSNGGQDIFLAKYDANGAHLWDRRFGGIGADSPSIVTVDAAGNIIMTGFFTFTTNFGGAPLVSAGSHDIFLAKYDPSGAHIWSKRFGDISGDEGSDVSVDAGGNIALVGFFQNTLFLGGPPLPSAGNQDIFAAKFDAAGNHLWSQRWGGSSLDRGISVKFDSVGNLVVLSTFQGSVNFGGGALVSAGGVDIALAKYDPSGAHVWSKRFGDSSTDFASSVAVDGADNIYLGAIFKGSVDFGGGPLASAGDEDIALAKYDATGAHQWSQRFGDTTQDIVSSVAVDNLGNVAMTGWYHGTVDFGGGPFPAVGLDEIYLAAYDSNGIPQWSEGFGDSLSDAGNSVAMAGGGCVVATGMFQRTVDFGGGPLTSGGYLDMYLAKYCAESPVPVLISQFNAKPGPRGVDLTWDFSTDEAVTGFTIYRGRGDSPLAMIASGDTRTPRSYSDMSAEPGASYRYQLVIRTASGNEFRSPLATATMPLAVAGLGQNFPNPFNPRTTIEYMVSDAGPVSIEIFDVAGKAARSLYQGVRKAGTYRVEWDGRGDNGQSLASGVYFYHLSGVKYSETRKMVLLK